jgi:PAS domain S-box-containing protein
MADRDEIFLDNPAILATFLALAEPVLNQINCPLCLYDLKGMIVYMSPLMKSLLGYTADEHIAATVLELVGQGDHELNRLNLSELWQQTAQEQQFTINSRDGRELAVMNRISPLRQDDRIIGGILVMEDISKFVQIEEELTDSQQQLANIIESSPDATLVIDKAGKILYWNQAIVELTGIPSELMVGKDNYEHGWVLYNGERRPMLVDLIVDPDLNARHLYTEFRQEGDILVTDNNIAFLKGEPRVMWGRAAPLYNRRMQVIGAIETIRDITEYREREEDLKRSRAQLEVIFGSTVHALAITTEKRDHYTAGHQDRVADLACAIGREMGLPENVIENLKFAGTLHDIGKLYVPMDILNQSSKLSDIQRLLVMTHSEAGYDIIKNIPFPGPIAQIIEEHHERMDGSGYPMGLKGKDILIEARILAVADTVEAMASHRPYRPALGIEKALEEVKRNAGTLYDQDVVKACVKLITENRYQILT